MENLEYVFLVLTVIFGALFGFVLFLLFLHVLWLRFSRVYHCLTIYNASDEAYTVITSSRHLYQPDDSVSDYKSFSRYWFSALSEAKERETTFLSDLES